MTKNARDAVTTTDSSRKGGNPEEVESGNEEPEAGGNASSRSASEEETGVAEGGEDTVSWRFSGGMAGDAGDDVPSGASMSSSATHTACACGVNSAKSETTRGSADIMAGRRKRRRRSRRLFGARSSTYLQEEVCLVRIARQSSRGLFGRREKRLKKKRRRSRRLVGVQPSPHL